MTRDNREIVRCPTCGSACRIHGGDEGTNSFDPLMPYNWSSSCGGCKYERGRFCVAGDNCIRKATDLYMPKIDVSKKITCGYTGGCGDRMNGACERMEKCERWIPL